MSSRIFTGSGAVFLFVSLSFLFFIGFRSYGQAFEKDSLVFLTLQQAIDLGIKNSAKLKLFISRPRLSDIINGKAGISPLMALKLSKAFNTTPYFWLNMQNSYDLWQQSQKGSDAVEKVNALV